MEFVYKEITCDSTAAKGQKKKKKKKKTKKSATEAQRLQRAADAGLWTRVYEHYRCTGRHYKQGPHYWPDERGDHYKMEANQLEALVRHIKGNMAEGEVRLLAWSRILLLEKF